MRLIWIRDYREILRLREFKNYEPVDIERHIRDKGMVRKEKSLVAFTPHDRKILAFGAEAEQIAKKNINGVQIISPFRQGMIADYCVTVNEAGAKELSISLVSLEHFQDNMMVTDKNQYPLYDLFIVITKDEPEKYILEKLFKT